MWMIHKIARTLLFFKLKKGFIKVEPYPKRQYIFAWQRNRKFCLPFDFFLLTTIIKFQIVINSSCYLWKEAKSNLLLKFKLEHLWQKRIIALHGVLFLTVPDCYSYGLCIKLHSCYSTWNILQYTLVINSYWYTL